MLNQQKMCNQLLYTEWDNEGEIGAPVDDGPS